MARILVVGGAGYVGSAACAHLIDRGDEVWVLDDLSTGHRELALGARLYVARAGDKEEVKALLETGRFDAVMHFAAFASVAESVQYPGRYFENNVDQTRALVETMLECGIRRLIFSSTCAVFGDPGAHDISEDTPQKPINAYGESKLQAERLLQEFARDRGLQVIALRYFNAAGAESGGRVGEWHETETHLIPNVFAAMIKNQPMQVFGNDYPTSDGTAVRDYVHVEDLAKAHASAMDRLMAMPEAVGHFDAYNLGSGKGFSVIQVIRSAERATGRLARISYADRRPGDPPRLVAVSGKAKRDLGFDPSPDALDRILSTAWAWEKKRRTARPAVFLDRDGTLNSDPGYLSEPSQMELLPGVASALRRLRDGGFRLVVVSNQSGVARGLFPVSMLRKIHNELDRQLADSNVKIDHYELCIHHPDENCECRKPKGKLLQDAATRMNLDLSRSFMVGDKGSDMGAGVSARVRGRVLVRTGEGRAEEAKLRAGEAHFVADDLAHAVEWILANKG